MKCSYEDRRFNTASKRLLEIVDNICTEYMQQGYTLTLRQLYYQMVARGYIPNNQKEYDKIGDLVANGRNAGLIDWEAIEDRGRIVHRNSHWTSPADILGICSKQYTEDMWEGQENYCECWVEKQAMEGILERACTPLDVPYFCCRGYTSQTTIREAALRFIRIDRVKRQNIYIFYIGDHDPSGIDMTRDIQDRLKYYGVCNFELIRLALNMDQIVEYNPPPNPAKLTDSRANDYIRHYGNLSWELDALEPSMLVNLIQSNVKKCIDLRKWNSKSKQIKLRQFELATIANNYNDTIRLLKENGIYEDKI